MTRHDNQKAYMRNHRPRYKLWLDVILWFPVLLVGMFFIGLALALMGVL